MATVRTIDVCDDAVEGANFVYYPLWFAQASVSWRRLFMSRREETLCVCVDGVRGVASRVDTVPPTQEIDVPEKNVLPAAVVEKDAVEKAETLALWWARTRLFSWWSPAVSLRTPILYYKPYVLESGPEGQLLRDSVSGETIALQV